MKRKSYQSIEWLEFEILQEFSMVRHAVFLRGEEFDLWDNGSPENQNEVLKLMGLERGVKLKQCHKTDIVVVENATKGWTLYENFDGVMTSQKGIGLLVRHADCQAAIFFDPKQEVIANVHSGWRGSVKNIFRKAVEKMKKVYGTNPEDIRVCISPSLGPEMAEFKHYQNELPREFWIYQKRPTYFDFWEISRMQLIQAGIQKNHIEIAGICTYLNPQDCFSYRRDKPTGHHGTLAAFVK